VCTISDFRELNKCIVREPYHIPKISTTLQELEGFTYATTLHLNMGYYTIRLDPTASDMCTVLFPWVRPHSRQYVHYHIFLRQILLSEVADGICQIG
jgi:hypothetical protein